MNNEASLIHNPMPANGMPHLPDYLMLTNLSDQEGKGTVEMNYVLRIDSLMWPMPGPPLTVSPDPGLVKGPLVPVGRNRGRCPHQI